MTKKVEYCYQHPNVVATHTCTLCENKICFNCKHEIFGHIFCGMQCLTIFVVKKIIQGLFQVFRILFRLLFWPFAQLKHLRHLSWKGIVVSAILIYCVIHLWLLNRDMNTIRGNLSGPQSLLALSDSAAVPDFSVFQPLKGGMVKSNLLNITGEVEENHMVSLSIDGQLKHVVLPRDGNFRFKNVNLHRGQNHVIVRATSAEGKSTVLQELTFTYSAPTVDYLMRSITRGSKNIKAMALTFDGGSQNNITEEILNSLKEKDILCTFFLTGEFIQRYPKTVKRIVRDGHEVGNHTWSHPKLTTFEENRKQETMPGVTAEKIKQELEKTAMLFKMVTGKNMAGLWRAPYGYYNKEILGWAAEAGYKHVGWTVGRDWHETMDTLDWVADKESGAYRSADEIAAKILGFAGKSSSNGNGAIILMHLGSERKDDFPHKKLPEIIDGLKKQGYDLVKISSMVNES